MLLISFSALRLMNAYRRERPSGGEARLFVYSRTVEVNGLPDQDTTAAQ